LYRQFVTQAPPSLYAVNRYPEHSPTYPRHNSVLYAGMTVSGSLILQNARMMKRSMFHISISRTPASSCGYVSRQPLISAPGKVATSAPAHK